MELAEDYADLDCKFWEFMKEFGKVMHHKYYFNEDDKYEKMREHINSLREHLNNALLDVKEIRVLTKGV